MFREWRLFEAAIVLGVVLLGLAIGLPAILASRDSARELQCQNNLRQISVGLLNYQMAAHGFPYGTIPNQKLPPEKRWSWYVGAWEYVIYLQVDRELDLNAAWDTPANLGRTQGNTTLRCPAAAEATTPSRVDPTTYLGSAGIGPEAPAGPLEKNSGVFGYDRQTRHEDLTRGAEFTILLFETNDRIGPYTAGGPSTVRGVDPQSLPILGIGRPWGGLHKGKAYVSMADGSGRALSYEMDPAVLLPLTTVAVDEAIKDAANKDAAVKGEAPKE